MKLVVAVSGGIDSVVLLDTLVKTGGNELIVAHFDHGIRSDSADDAQFVAGLAKKYNLPFEMRREELGKMASEDYARRRRYDFLFTVAQKYQARLTTAHHADDVIETIALNLTRGTGWRGLAGLSDSRIYRPLTHLYKSEIRAYAQVHHLRWHEDSTNKTTAYLRNRLRRKLAGLDRDVKQQLLALWDCQRRLAHIITNEENSLMPTESSYSRYFFIQIDLASGLELLRHITRGALTYPQLIRLLMAIKTFPAGKLYQAGAGISIRFTSRYFSLKMIN